MQEIEKEMYDSALRLLVIREHSELELYNKLQRKFKCPDSGLIHSVINKLISQDYLSNKRYVESRVKGLLAKRNGPHHIIQKLSIVGISSTEANAELVKYQDIVTRNLEVLILKKFKDSTFEAKSNLIKKLMNKGYSLDSILKKVDEYLAKYESS